MVLTQPKSRCSFSLKVFIVNLLNDKVRKHIPNALNNLCKKINMDAYKLFGVKH